jgi:hypothetical protein
MDNTTPTPETNTAVTVTEKPAKTKRVPRVIKTAAGSTPKKLTKPKAAEAAVPPKAEKPKLVHFHIENKVDTTKYSGLSSYLNDNRKANPRDLPPMLPAKLHERSLLALAALREAYGQRQFRVRGFDNNIIAMLRAAGLIELHGGTTIQDGNYRRFVDGATPLVGKLTAQGMRYGVATA